MNKKDKDAWDVPEGQKVVQPLEISINAREVENQFTNILAQGAEAQLVLPKGIWFRPWFRIHPATYPALSPSQSMVQRCATTFRET